VNCVTRFGQSTTEQQVAAIKLSLFLGSVFGLGLAFGLFFLLQALLKVLDLDV
jgi:hypothetical protein